MTAGDIALGDVICDSRYAHRVPTHFALSPRVAGASLVVDLHPSDRGTHAGVSPEPLTTVTTARLHIRLASHRALVEATMPRK